MRAAASWEAPIFRPTTRLARFAAPPWRRMLRLVRTFAGFSVVPSAVSSTAGFGAFGLRRNESEISFFSNEPFSGSSSIVSSSGSSSATGSGSAAGTGSTEVGSSTGASSGSGEWVSSSSASSSSAASCLRPNEISLFQSTMGYASATRRLGTVDAASETWKPARSSRL